MDPHEEIRSQGREARLLGRDTTANPYDPWERVTYGSWLVGWAEVHADLDAPAREISGEMQRSFSW